VFVCLYNVIFTPSLLYEITDRYTHISLLLTQYMLNVINNLRKARGWLLYFFFIPFLFCSFFSLFALLVTFENFKML